MIQPVSFSGKKLSVNSREFYDKHPDLAPRNVHLYLGRVITREQIDKKLEETFREPFIKRAKNWFTDKTKKIFKKDK